MVETSGLNFARLIGETHDKVLQEERLDQSEVSPKLAPAFFQSIKLHDLYV